MNRPSLHRVRAPRTTAAAANAGSAHPRPPTSDPVALVLEVLRNAGHGLTAGGIKAALVEAGVVAAAAASAWNRARDKVRFDDHVEVDVGGKIYTYRWTATARDLTAEEAVDRLSRNPDAAHRVKLLAVIRSALESGASDPADLAEARQKVAEAQLRISALEQELAAAAHSSATTPEPKPPAAPATPHDQAGTPHEEYEKAERRRAARERQARIDAMSTVAELAAEVEELTAKKAHARVLLEHTRALTEGRGLEAIGRAGEPTAYDESRHHPVGDFPNEGDPVTVIRPGYLWHAPGDAVLISKALVTRG